MAKKKWSPSNLFKQLLFFLVGAVLTGFLTVFFAKFLGHYINATASPTPSDTAKWMLM